MSHSAEKCQRGTLWVLLTYILLQDIKKLKKNFGDPLATKKTVQKGGPRDSSGFEGHVKKVKNERGTLCTKFALAGLGLSSFC